MIRTSLVLLGVSAWISGLAHFSNYAEAFSVSKHRFGMRHDSNFRMSPKDDISSSAAVAEVDEELGGLQEEMGARVEMEAKEVDVTTQTLEEATIPFFKTQQEEARRKMLQERLFAVQRNAKPSQPATPNDQIVVEEEESTKPPESAKEESGSMTSYNKAEVDDNVSMLNLYSEYSDEKEEDPIEASSLTLGEPMNEATETVDKEATDGNDNLIEEAKELLSKREAPEAIQSEEEEILECLSTEEGEPTAAALKTDPIPALATGSTQADNKEDDAPQLIESVADVGGEIETETKQEVHPLVEGGGEEPVLQEPALLGMKYMLTKASQGDAVASVEEGLSQLEPEAEPKTEKKVHPLVEGGVVETVSRQPALLGMKYSRRRSPGQEIHNTNNAEAAQIEDTKEEEAEEVVEIGDEPRIEESDDAASIEIEEEVFADPSLEAEQIGSPIKEDQPMEAPNAETDAPVEAANEPTRIDFANAPISPNAQDVQSTPVGYLRRHRKMAEEELARREARLKAEEEATQKVEEEAAENEQAEVAAVDSESAEEPDLQDIEVETEAALPSEDSEGEFDMEETPDDTGVVGDDAQPPAAENTQAEVMEEAAPPTSDLLEEAEPSPKPSNPTPFVLRSNEELRGIDKGLNRFRIG